MKKYLKVLIIIWKVASVAFGLLGIILYYLGEEWTEVMIYSILSLILLALRESQLKKLEQAKQELEDEQA